jgi:hypothetical protein
MLVAATCAAAAYMAVSRQQARWHLTVWTVVALLFALLAVLRFLALEEMLRDSLRLALVMEGTYDERRSVQRPLVAALIVLAAAAAGWFSVRVLRGIRGRRNIAAVAAGLAASIMVFLVTLRLISLSPVDALLYGAFKLNWIVDIGSSMIACGCALTYWQVVGSRR